MRITLISGSLLLVMIIVFGFIYKSGDKKQQQTELIKVDFGQIPKNKFGDEVRYGLELMRNTAYYIGPEGKIGKFLGNKMNCTNCHQDAGTKAFSFNLIAAHDNYPQYRAREGKVLTLADRINNCVERPHNGKPLPQDSREMVALLSYLKWISQFAPGHQPFMGSKNLEIKFPDGAASSARGESLYQLYCKRCHSTNGDGLLRADHVSYTYPPLWGPNGYQPGSSMHRIIKMAQWLKANMPYDKAKWNEPFLSDEQALDIAAFINDDAIHQRPLKQSTGDYPFPEEKAIDYASGPFIDSFPVKQHKLGPFTPIITYWKQKSMNPVY